MALTIDTDFPVEDLHADYICKVKRIDFDSSYPTGGEALTPANLGFSDDGDNLIVVIPPKAGYVFEYDGANEKVKVYVEEAVAAGGPLVEVGNTTDLSALTNVVVFAYGRKPT